MVKRYVMMAVLVIMACSMTMAQSSREFIRNEIEKRGECRNVAITKSNGDLMFSESKSQARHGFSPTKMASMITRCSLC